MTAKRATPRTPAKSRKTQAQRREATRTKILDATLYCLARHGYAQTGVSQIVKRARVSRGAWSHHFPSMNALMLEAAQHLAKTVYQRLGVVLQALALADDPAKTVVHRIWSEFFASEVNDIYVELLIASRRDPKLAAALNSLTVTLELNLRSAADSFFEARPGAAQGPAHMLLMMRWMLRGLALDAHALPQSAIDLALASWAELLATQIRAKRG